MLTFVRSTVIFGSAQKLADVHREVIPNTVVNDTVIDYCKSVKYLGIILEETLTWSLQITDICKRSMRVLAQLKMNGDVFSLPIRKRLVTTLIFPIFDYCAAVYTDITGQQQIRLQRKLNACVRYIVKISKYEHVTQYYADLRWLTIGSRRKFFLSCLIYKALYLNQKPLIKRDLKILEPRLRRGDIRQDYLELPLYHFAKYEKSFLISAIKTWNQLSACCTRLSTFSEFRTACYQYFLENNRL
ncbi:uncharacterized protein LOC141532456 [Cotesia typhae]|uniref:uncharacterized protein LOC141532456 n=1 Tax=Cotesia typhae TaxID=2053667 RepID=UPI003D6925F0